VAIYFLTVTFTTQEFSSFPNVMFVRLLTSLDGYDRAGELA
jgi:hypothetical protein